MSNNEIKSVSLELLLPESEQNNNCPDADNKEQLRRCEQKVAYIKNQSIEKAVQQSKKRKRCEMEESDIPAQLRNKTI